MDLAAHAFAQRGIDHAVAGERQLATEISSDDGGLEVHAVIALDLGTGAGQPLFDQLADGVWGHGESFPR